MNMAIPGFAEEEAKANRQILLHKDVHPAEMELDRHEKKHGLHLFRQGIIRAKIPVDTSFPFGQLLSLSRSLCHKHPKWRGSMFLRRLSSSKFPMSLYKALATYSTENDLIYFCST
jgi:hypothetical protein